MNGVTLTPNSSCAFTVQFAPLANGPQSTALSIPYDAPNSSSTFSSNISVTGAGSTLTGFAGLDSISAPTPTALTLNWTHVAGAATYQIYSVLGGVPTFVAQIASPTATYAATTSNGSTALTANTAYTFRVRATDAL